MKVTKEIQLNGKTFSLETGRFAKQAHGAVMVRYGDTMVLATVVSDYKAKEGQDFFPLQVEYREKTAAAGKIPGGFFKREGRPTEKEILSSRLIDRPIRPMFPKTYKNETQLLVTVYSSDMEHDGDVLGACAASAALMVSDIPFDGPVAEVRVGRIDGKYIVNPTFKELESSDLDITLAGTNDSIVMVEGESAEASENDLLQALRVGHEAIKELCSVQIELAKEVNKLKRDIVVPEIPAGMKEEINFLAEAKMKQLSRTIMAKEERSEATNKLYTEIQTLLAEKYPEKELLIDELLLDIERDAMRSTILNDGKRLDGRNLKDIRPITCEVGILPRTAWFCSLYKRRDTESYNCDTRNKNG